MTNMSNFWGNFVTYALLPNFLWEKIGCECVGHKIAQKIGHISHISTYLGVPKDMEDLVYKVPLET